MSECGDDERDWFPQRSVCWPTAQLKAAERLYEKQHEERPYHDGSFSEWASQPSLDYPFHYMDGVSFWLSPVDLNPEDDWLGNVPASDADEDEGA